jgi:ABC-2 type transport system permease protein
MSARVWFVIAHQQAILLLRDRRLRIAGIAFLLICAAAWVSALARNERISQERAAATRAEALVWSSQGKVDPHGAAHFGQYVFKPVSPLSIFEPGLQDQLGTVVRLEAHQQSPASHRPSDAGTALSRFASFSLAAALQVLAPLLLIFTGFTTFSGERARTLLRQEISSGVSPRGLMLGRLLAQATVIGAILSVLALVGVITLFVHREALAAYVRLGGLIASYGLYLCCFLAVTLGISACCSSARSSLAASLAFWGCTVLLVPRIAPAVAAHLQPTPSAIEFQAAVDAALDRAFDGDHPRTTRSQRVKAMILRKYGVSREADLPINLRGESLQYAEQLSTEAFREQYRQLYGIYHQQARLERAFTPLSLLVPVRAWTASLAGTDFGSHERFLAEADAHRFQLVQRLNDDIRRNRPKNATHYVNDIAHVTADLDHFAPSTEPVANILNRQWPDALALLIWTLASGTMCWLCAARLSEQS